MVGTYFNLIENEQIGGIQYFEDSENPKGGIVYTTLGEDISPPSFYQFKNDRITAFRDFAQRMQRVNDFVPFRSQLEHIVFDFHHETPHGVCAYLKAKKNVLPLCVQYIIII